MTPVMQSIDKYQHIGDVEIPLGQILIRGSLSVALLNGHGELKIVVTQNAHGRGILSMVVAFAQMPKNHWLNKNYPQLFICKQDKINNRWVPVYHSEVINRSDSGQWSPISLPCHLLCSNDYSRSIRFLVKNNEPGKKIFSIGHCDVPVQLLKDALNLQLGLIPSNKNLARAGIIIIRAATLVERLTFYGNIRKNLRFNFSCSIDFSSSDAKSLHYATLGKDNDYESSFKAIGGIVEQYSNTKVCHCWIFGVKMNQQIYHAIPLTNKSGSSDLNRVKELGAAYWRILEKIQFDETCEITPSTLEALELIKGQKDPSKYMVFLILINGDPLDLDKFIDLLFGSQNEPLSVVIVGIGTAEFNQTETKLRESPLKNSEGKEFEREFVKFLKFNDFENIDNMTEVALKDVAEQAANWIEILEM
ncbi:Copine family protein [Histomonas meleagridis]|uniref:Copine family protein n=1 Tax=Histomonas meleagridis TaxID=135588 RepID=UPI003559A147|nr:Copine family protein [Histomonas meleagridis]KAH0798930.1 Copine family protein [Histomonas meleagridis]